LQSCKQKPMMSQFVCIGTIHRNAWSLRTALTHWSTTTAASVDSILDSVLHIFGGVFSRIAGLVGRRLGLVCSFVCRLAYLLRCISDCIALACRQVPTFCPPLLTMLCCWTHHCFMSNSAVTVLPCACTQRTQIQAARRQFPCERSSAAPVPM
jgi:hypothetical protein